MITANGVIAAIKLVDAYCDERDCEMCIFCNVVCPYGFTRAEWKQIQRNAKRLEGDERGTK